MEIKITLTAGKGGGKTHLSKALQNFLREEYPSTQKMEVTIIELYPDSEQVHAATMFTIRPRPPLSDVFRDLLKG